VSVRAPSGEFVDAARACTFVGLVPQELAFYPTLTVGENLRFFAAMQGLQGSRLGDRVAAALAVGRLESVTRQRAETLSGGLKRRLNFAIGVINEPRLLVLDEPTVGVDAQSRNFLREELQRLNGAGTTIIYSSHYLEEIQQLCDQLAVIDHGKVVAQGAVADLLRQTGVTLKLTEVPPESFLARLREIPAVTQVRQQGVSITLISLDPQAALTAALTAAQQSALAVAEATMGLRNLEALFFQLTGTQLRDHGDDSDVA
jgi:ABC-2 type transport system ATP-binding protein